MAFRSGELVSVQRSCHHPCLHSQPRQCSGLHSSLRHNKGATAVTSSPPAASESVCVKVTVMPFDHLLGAGEIGTAGAAGAGRSWLFPLSSPEKTHVFEKFLMERGRPAGQPPSWDSCSPAVPHSAKLSCRLAHTQGLAC